MMRAWSTLLVAAVVLSGSFAVSCARGPMFTPLTAIPQGQAVVYVYRPKSPLGGAVSYFVEVNGTKVVKLKNGGYRPVVTPPGTIVFSAKTEALSQAAIDVVAGGSYFIKGGVKMGAFVGRPDLQQVHHAIAVNEIQRCTLLPGL